MIDRLVKTFLGAPILAILLCAVLAGWGVPVRRALIFLLALLLGLAQRRPGLRLQPLALAALVILAWEPEALFAPGAQLSFAACAALALAAPRDPLAPAPQSFVTDPGLRDRVSFVTTPFQSLEPALVLERARRQLRPPPGVKLSLEEGRLSAVGVAPPSWLDPIRALPILPPRVARFRMDGEPRDPAAWLNTGWPD